MNKEQLIEDIIDLVEELDWTIVSPDDNIRSLLGLLDSEALSLIFTELDSLKDKKREGNTNERN